MRLKKRFNLRKLQKKGKFLFLAYDQGLEHGPVDFNDSNADPKSIIRIAREGNFTGLIFQKGIAEKYYEEIKASRIPLIVKLNGKTSLVKSEPFSPTTCTVSEAIDLGATAVGFTVYLGSAHEEKMFTEFVNIQREAHKAGLPVIAWMYPRGSSIKGMKKKVLLAYAARVGLELGADIVKLHWDGNKKNLEWAIKNAGKVRVVIAGGKKAKERELLKDIKNAMSVGGSGLAIGRNIWQNKNPLNITNKIKKIIWA